MNKPLVSVIIPNYNYAHFLSKRIETVLNQTYQNIEVIILDDCSEDNSREIIERYRNYAKVSQIVYNNNNSGSPFKQWYKGISLAKGELVWIAESDDYAKLNFLETLINEYISKESVSFVYSDLIVVDKDGVELVKETKEHCHNMKSTVSLYNGIEFIKERMVDMCRVCNASSVIFKREIALQIRDSYTNYKASGDYLFWINMAEKGNVIKVDIPLDYFRLHNNNVTPLSYRNGTSLIENYSIFKHIVINKYLSPKEALYYYLLKLEKIKYDMSLSEITKKKVLRVWDPLHLFNKYIMSFCWKLIDK